MPEVGLLRLQSEPYAATGNIGDGGFRRLLGTPSLELLQLVIREAVQNSCDAAKLGSGPEVLIRVRTLSPEQLAFLRRKVLRELPFVPESKAALEAFLRSEEPRVLEICDFRTTGLGGPTRADRMPEGTTRTDFIDFLRNVGTQRNTAQGGGTYGFGKASLYMASRCSTILVDTLTSVEGTEQRRVMGCHLGASGERPDGKGFVTKYTGRHWWGLRERNGVTEPATGELAQEIAEALGVPARPPGATGTTIMILDPDLGAHGVGDDIEDEPDLFAGRDADPVAAAASRLAGGVLWNFWPRMMETTPAARRIEARIFVEDIEVPLPPPEQVPPLDHYCAAMNMIRNGDPDVVRVRKYGRVLGRLAVTRGLRSSRVHPFDDPGTFGAPAAGIATMRPVELVVKIEPGPALPDERVEWAGVFVASDEPDIEEAFALSEPAAHDAWDPATLPDGAQRKWVRAAVRRIRDVARSVAAPEPTSVASAGETTPLAAVAGRLGQFLKGRGHGGPTSGGGSGGSGASGSRRRRVSGPVFERLQLVEGEPAAEFRLAVTGRGPENTLLLAPVFAVDGSGISIDEGSSQDRPRILSVTDGSGKSLKGLQSAWIGDMEGEIRVLVTVPPDCAISIRADLEKGQ